MTQKMMMSCVRMRFKWLKACGNIQQIFFYYPVIWKNLVFLFARAQKYIVNETGWRATKITTRERKRNDKWLKNDRNMCYSNWVERRRREGSFVGWNMVSLEQKQRVAFFSAITYSYQKRKCLREKWNCENFACQVLWENEIFIKSRSSHNRYE